MGDQTDQRTATYCASCGQLASGGPYCTACGARVLGESADDLAAAATAEFTDTQAELRVHDRRAASTPTPAAAAPLPSYRPSPVSGFREPPGALVPARRPSWLPWLAVGVALALVGAGVAVYFVTRGGSDTTTGYRHRVAAIFGPVLGSNRAVSRSLGTLSHPGHVPTVRQAVRQAQGSVSTAQGALSALEVPSGANALAVQARKALARESSYLTSVAAILADPAHSTPANAQTQASNLTAALAAGGPTLAGTSSTVSGADLLTAWAGRVAHHTTPPANSGTPANSSPSPPTNPYANGRDCGDGVFAGPNTSCEFAVNVRDAYNDAPGAAASVEVYSPDVHDGLPARRQRDHVLRRQQRVGHLLTPSA